MSAGTLPDRTQPRAHVGLVGKNLAADEGDDLGAALFQRPLDDDNPGW
jgi:hypothetical protein